MWSIGPVLLLAWIPCCPTLWRLPKWKLSVNYLPWVTVGFWLIEESASHGIYPLYAFIAGKQHYDWSFNSEISLPSTVFTYLCFKLSLLSFWFCIFNIFLLKICKRAPEMLLLQFIHLLKNCFIRYSLWFSFKFGY